MSVAVYPGQDRERFIRANGLDLCVETRGNPVGETVMFVMGLAGQKTLWPDRLIDQYIDAGYHVVLFDNRDIGLSEKIGERVEGHPLAAMTRYRMGLSVPAPYTLHEMADDVVDLMDALGIATAHLFGVSMGGMISQLVAGRYPDRVQSVTLVMTSSNSPRLPLPKPSLVWRLSGVGAKGHDEESVVNRSLTFWKSIQSPLYPTDATTIADRVRRDYRRCYHPAGILRQTRAIMGTGSLEPISRRIQVPTAIIHGKADPLVRPVAAQQLQKLIPHGELHLVEGMGHDLPEALMPRLAEVSMKVMER